MRKYFIAFIICGLSLVAILPVNAARNGRVLFISSYSYVWESVPKQIEGIKLALSSSTTLDVEFMDTKRFNDEESLQRFYQELQYKINRSDPYDVVIVGHARQERIALVDKLEKICSVGTYGAGWKNSLGVVNGKKHVDAINSGRMYISFSKTVAGFNNVKVGLFEAIACKQVVFTEYMEELADYFEINKLNFRMNLKVHKHLLHAV